MVYSQSWGNEKTERNNKIKILSNLQSDKSPFSFNELIERTKLNPSILSKHLKKFGDNKLIADKKNRKEKYQITNKGILEYRRLLAEEYGEKLYDDKNLMDSLIIPKEKIETSQGRFTYQATLSVSGVLDNKKEQAIKTGINEKVLPVLLKLCNDNSTTSGAILIKLHKEK